MTGTHITTYVNGALFIAAYVTWTLPNAYNILLAWDTWVRVWDTCLTHVPD